MTRRSVLALLGALLAVAAVPSAPVVATQPGISPLRAYLAKAVSLTEADLAALDRGRPIARALPSRNGAEIFVLGAIHVRARPDAYITRAMDPSQLLSLPGYRGTGLIGEPPEASDFTGFTLEPDDIEELRDCRAGDCAVQLPASVIPTLRAVARIANPSTAAARANALMRDMVVRLVRDYRLRGNAALPPYEDESRPANVGEHFRSLMQRFADLALAPPEVTALMLDWPSSPAPRDLQSVFYWERVVFGLKPTLRVTHAVAYAPPAPSPLG